MKVCNCELRGRHVDPYTGRCNRCGGTADARDAAKECGGCGTETGQHSPGCPSLDIGEVAKNEGTEAALLMDNEGARREYEHYHADAALGRALREKLPEGVDARRVVECWPDIQCVLVQLARSLESDQQSAVALGRRENAAGDAVSILMRIGITEVDSRLSAPAEGEGVERA